MSPQLRVCFDYQVFTLQRYGGVSRYFCEIAQRIDREPAATACIVAPLSINEHLRESRTRHFGLHVPDGKYTTPLARAAGRYSTPVTRLIRPSVVHETYYSARGTAPRGCPTVLTVFDMIHERLADMFNPRDPTTARKRAAVARADHVICISENTRRDLVEIFDVPIGKTTVTHLGFLASPEEDRPASPSRPEVPYLLYVGARDGYKNFRLLARAYAASALLRRSFRIIAFGGGGFSKGEQEFFGELGLEPKQIAHESGSDAQLVERYRQAGAFIYPSLYEGFGIPPLEAFDAGCPVVCANASSIPEVVADAGEYFDPHSVDGLRTAIEKVVTDDAYRAALVARGRTRVRNFSWERCTQETLTIYRRLVA